MSVFRKFLLLIVLMPAVLVLRAQDPDSLTILPPIEGIEEDKEVPEDSTWTYEALINESEYKADRTEEHEGKNLPIPGSRGYMNYALQRRYRPTDSTYVDPKSQHNLLPRLLNNTSLSIEGSTLYYSADNYSSGPYLTMGLGKTFGKYHEIRLRGGSGYVLDNLESNIHVKIVDGRADYLFHLLTYFSGFRSNRLVEISSIMGAGYTVFWKEWTRAGLRFAPSAHLGMRLSMHVAKGLDYYIQPELGLQRDAMGESRMNLWHGYMGYFRGSVGVSYRIDRWNSLLPIDQGGSWTTSLSAGPVIQTREHYKGTAGMRYAVSFGRRYGGRFSWNLTGSWSRCYWKPGTDVVVNGRMGDRDKYAQTLWSFSLDAGWDLVSCYQGGHGEYKDKAHRIGISAFAGPEIGYIRKWTPPLRGEERASAIYQPYVGLSTGGDLSLRVWDRPLVLLFIEPRVSFVPYSGPNKERVPAYANYYDVFFTIQGGIRLLFPQK